MKKTLRFLLLFLASALTLPATAQFIHPGCLHTQADFDRINAQLEAGDHPTLTNAWNSFNDNWLLTYTGSWIGNISGDQIIRNSGGNFAHSERDFGMCYIKALYWSIKHNSSNTAEKEKAELLASQAVALLNKYAKKINGIGGDSNYALVGAFQGWQVANAGELLRDYSGWSAEDQARYKQWIYDVWYASSQDFLKRQNGTCPSHYQSNWNTGSVTSLQAIGIYLDDPFIYNEAMYYLKQSDQNCSIADDKIGTGLGYLVYKWDTDSVNAQLAAKGIDARYQSPLGFLYQNQESTRDQPHCMGALGCQLQTLEQAWNQGDNAYGWNDQAMAGGVEYTAGFVSADDDDSIFMSNYPNKAWTGCDAYQATLSYSGRTNATCIYQIAVNHFANRMGLNMPYATKAHQRVCDSWDWGVEWGAGVNNRYYYSDVCGFGDLMFNQDSATVHPTLLRGKICMVSGSNTSYLIGSYKSTEERTKSLAAGDSIFTNELSNIAAGSVLRLCPMIMDGSDDTGHWTWDDDSTCTTRERLVTVAKSCLLRARYTNASGVVCTQLFSLHVEGEGWIASYSPYYISDYTTYYDSVTYIKKYADITLGLSYSSASSVRSWKWEKKTLTGTTWNTLSSSTSSTLELSSVTTGAYYRVTMTNNAGATVSQEYKVDVSEIDPYIVNGDDDAVNTTSMGVPRGSDVKLFAVPNSISSKATDATRIYKWVADEDTLKIDTLTYHVDNNGTNVADLNDTLFIIALDSCFECTLSFERIASSGGTSTTILHFSVPVYETNDLVPGTNPYYYIIDPESGKYFNNTDATFTDYDEENDDAFQWKFRKLSSSYGNRYYISSKVNSSQHLADNGTLSTSTNYSLYSFNLLHKYSDEKLYAIQQSATSSGYFLTVNQDLYEMAENTTSNVLSSFPFQIVSVESDTLVGLNDVPLVEKPVLTWAYHDKQLVLDAQEAGVLRMYSLSGTLLKESSCAAGLNTIANEVSLFGDGCRGMLICQYVTISGKQKLFKLLY